MLASSVVRVVGRCLCASTTKAVVIIPRCLLSTSPRPQDNLTPDQVRKAHALYKEEEDVGPDDDDDHENAEDKVVEFPLSAVAIISYSFLHCKITTTTISHIVSLRSR